MTARPAIRRDSRRTALVARWSRGGAIPALAAAMAVPVPAAAQFTPAPTREEIQRDTIDTRPAERAAVAALGDEVERAPCPLADPRFAELRTTLREAQFTGLDAIGPDLVRPAWEPYVGQDIPVAAVCEIRDRAATILRRSGYLASVQIPAQEIADGVVRFDVLVGRLTTVQVRGDPGRSAGALQRFVDRITGAEVFDIDAAERYLLLARDIPGLDVRLTLRPASSEIGGAPGELVGIIDVARQPLAVDLNVQNFGSDEVGRFGGLLRARFNGLTGLGDETVVSGFLTADPSEQQVFQAAHSFFVGGEGLRLGAEFTYAETQPDVPGPDVFDSRTIVASAFAAYPVLRSQTRNVSVSAGFDLIEQEVEFAGLPLSEDDLRVAFARIDYSSLDLASLVGRGGYSPIEPRLGVQASFELRHGIGGLGASDPCGVAFADCFAPGAVPLSRLDGDPSGFAMRAEGSIEFRPRPGILLALRPRVQYSPDRLLSYEQYSGGNFTVGRGYDPGAVIGDSGYGAQAEVAFGSLLPRTPGGVATQTFFYVDHVGVFTNGVPGDPQDITSAGGGLRLAIADRAFLETFIAVPIERAPTQARRGDPRFFLNLTVLLAPWR